MVELLDEPEKGLAIGRRASLDMRREFSYRAIGVRTAQLLTNAMQSEIGEPRLASVTQASVGSGWGGADTIASEASAREEAEAAPAFHRELSGMDAELRAGRPLTPELLSRVPLEVLGDVYLGLRGQYPALLAALPSMAPAEVQRNWTGNDGQPLTVQSCLRGALPLEDSHVKWASFGGQVTRGGERPGLLAFCPPTTRPWLRVGDIVCLDNLGTHKVKGVREAIQAASAIAIYLPPYIPDLNPIELS